MSKKRIIKGVSTVDTNQKKEKVSSKSIEDQLNSLFDENYYLSANADIRNNDIPALEHYLSFGHKEGRCPNILFDPIYYRLSNMEPFEYDMEPMQHYLKNGKNLLDPHPLFDSKFYQTNWGKPIKDMSLLEHFLTIGWKEKVSPTPHFDFEYYLENNSDIREAKMNPLLHYLQYGENENRKPNIDFIPSDSPKPAMYKLWNHMAYQERRKLTYFAIYKEGKPDIFHPTVLDKLEDIIAPTRKLSRVFDSEYYLNVYDDIRTAGLNPFDHYVNYGTYEGRLPNALFDPGYYRLNNMEAGTKEEPLNHYIKNHDKKLNPHPLFDTEYYAKQLDNESLDGKTYLEHFLQKGWKKGISPTPHFDIEYYLETYPNIKQHKLNPLIHYLTFGEKEGYSPSPNFYPNFFEKPPKLPEENVVVFKGKTKLQFYAEDKLVHNKPFQKFLTGLYQVPKDEPCMIFVTHDASRTGAPLIILRLAEYFKKHLGITPINISFGGKDLLSDFDVAGPTYTLQYYGKNEESLDIEFVALCNALKARLPIGALVNSAESRRMLPYLKNQNIKVISLVHEMANYYPKDAWKIISKNSELVVFPSQPVLEQAVKNTAFKKDQVLVKGQGLFKPELLKVDKTKAKAKLRKQLKLSKDAFIILGCGTANERKGIDIFVATAIDYLQSNTQKNNVYFVWLGEIIDEYCINRALQDIEITGLNDKILFPGAVSDTSTFFVGSDMFYLTSRADPFPCVVHEAMAAQLVLVGFEGTGGFVEAIDNTCGYSVPFRDLSQVTEIIDDLYAHPEKLKMMGAKAKTRVINEFDYLKYTKEVGQLFIDLPTDVKNKKIINAKKATLAKAIDGKVKFQEKKKVIFALNDWYISGVNTVVDNLVRQLNKLGYDAYILFTSQQSLGQPEEFLPDAPYRFLTDKYLNTEETWDLLKEYLEAATPCVFFPNCDYVASSLSPDLNNDVGIVGVLHSDDSEHYEHGYRLGHYWNHIVTVSGLLKTEMKKYNPLFDPKTTAIYNGIDVEDLKESPNKNTKFSIIYTGRIVQYQKRIFDLYKIAEKLDERGVDFVFTFIGGGEDEGDFRAMIQPLEEKGRIRYLGRQPMKTVFKELKKHHVFALFSDFEGLPMSLLEALACWCVPVVTDIKSGIQEVLESGKNSIISPLDDIDTFVDNLEKLSKDPKSLAKLAKNAYATLKEKKLRSEDMGESYAKVIDAVFKEIESKVYERPEALTFRSPFGNRLIPPMMQKL